MFYKRILIPLVVNDNQVNSEKEKEKNVDVLARTIWGEARGENLAGMEAVANVVLNRVRHAKKFRKGFWWGDDVVSVCLKPYQFSCWNRDDVNFSLIQKIDKDDKAFTVCKRIAQKAVQGNLQDNTRGATHYHSKSIFPTWALNQQPTIEIGQHVFYQVLD